MSNLTTNKNFLTPVGFQFKINSTRYANLEYFCIGASLPTVGLTQIDVGHRGVNLAVTGDRLTFDDLTLRVNVTEDMENYIETFNWLHNIAQKGNSEDFKEDATLLILSSHNNVNKQIRFKGVFPTSLGGIEFNTQGDTEFAQVDITFAYTYFEIE